MIGVPCRRDHTISLFRPVGFWPSSLSDRPYVICRNPKTLVLLYGGNRRKKKSDLVRTTLPISLSLCPHRTITHSLVRERIPPQCGRGHVPLVPSLQDLGAFGISRAIIWWWVSETLEDEMDT